MKAKPRFYIVGLYLESACPAVCKALVATIIKMQVPFLALHVAGSSGCRVHCAGGEFKIRGLRDIPKCKKWIRERIKMEPPVN